MRHPTPTFTARSRQGAEALETAAAAGEALEASGRRVRFWCGAVGGAVLGFFVVSNLWSNEPIVRGWLDATGAVGYWLMVLGIALITGVASVHMGTGAWKRLYGVWHDTDTRS